MMEFETFLLWIAAALFISAMIEILDLLSAYPSKG
jgi:hypothetical protein